MNTLLVLALYGAMSASPSPSNEVKRIGPGTPLSTNIVAVATNSVASTNAPRTFTHQGFAPVKPAGFGAGAHGSKRGVRVSRH